VRMKIRITKMILWFLAGLGSTVVVLRILHGPGSVTALTDILPWGVWKGWGVVALVPIGGAGFTLAMLVYVFRADVFKPVVRGAVLLGLICYSGVAFGLTMDIGIWWRIVFPVFHWQYHSVLFEIAWCIMLYLMVLFAEFGLTVLRQVGWRRVVSVLEKLSIFLVIFGICLSTLHQSSLGTLFLATPFRLHPLWYTDFLPLLFFISSMALGCLTISFLTIVVYWLYGGEPPMKAISALGRISAYLMIGYLVIKFAEILLSGEGPLLTEATWDTANFWIEVILSAFIPAILLVQKRYRRSRTAMFWVSLCAIVGMSLNRVNVAGLATVGLTHSVYIPTWTEWVMTFGILSGAALFYMFCVEHLGLFEGLGKERVDEWITPGRFDHTDWKTLYYGSQRLGAFHLNSLIFVLAAAISFGFLSEDSVFGVSPEATPTRSPRRVQVTRTGDEDSADTTFKIANNGYEPNTDGHLATVLMLDGDRNGRYVLFDHERHEARNEGEKGCVLCHHMNKPFDRCTGCYECHNDMYTTVEVFDHDLHVRMLGGNDHCADCHLDNRLTKVRENTKDCLSCHKAMVAPGSRVPVDSLGIDSRTVGYMDAMHGLCIKCHEESQQSMTTPNEELSRCNHCHQSFPEMTDVVWERLR
jgi:Ni/Fe-hydrogenase subunit HybB-like protein